MGKPRLKVPVCLVCAERGVLREAEALETHPELAGKGYCRAHCPKHLRALLPAPAPLTDTERLNWMEKAAVSLHCNYTGGPENWSITDDYGAEVRPVYHGATLREAVDAFINGRTQLSERRRNSGAP